MKDTHYLKDELFGLVRSSPAIFEFLQAGSLDGIWYWDLENPDHEWMSPRFWEVLGHDPGTKKHLASEWQHLIHPDDLKVAVAAFEAHCADPASPYDLVVRYLSSDGSTVWVRCRGLAIRDDQGRPIRMLGAHNEITALKEMELDLERLVADRTADLREANRALATEMEERLALERKLLRTQKLESLGVLAGGIAHDFNNLLMGVLGNADLALMELSSASPARPRIEALKTTAQHLADLTNQLLAYSGRGQFVVTNVDLSEVVSELHQLLAVSLPKGVVVKTDLAEALPPIPADTSQLRQVVMNLITNAADAIGGKSGVVAVRTGVLIVGKHGIDDAWLGEGLPGGPYVFLEVSDTGVGMDAETQRSIFDPFFSTKPKGRGLGLAAVLGIMRGHSGAIRVYSEPGRGTTFKLFFPAADDFGEERPSPPLPVSGGGGLVLVVDDEETVRGMVTLLLEALGYSVVTANHGGEAIEVVRARGQELCAVLLDLTMPHVDGVEAFSEIHRLEPDLPVILSSGYNHQDATSHLAGKGLAGFIQKPYDLAGLARVLGQVVPS